MSGRRPLRAVLAGTLVAALGGAMLLGAAREPPVEVLVELDVWVTHGMVKVRPDDPAGPGREAELLAARNEFEPFQIVLRSPRPVRGVDVAVTDLEAADGGGHRLASRHAAVYLQRYIELSTPSSAAGGTGEWPDPLLPRTDHYAGERRDAFPFDLAAGRNQPLWLEVYVPPGTPPGRYRGAVRVAVQGVIQAIVPVSLEVLPFTLPSTASFPTSFGFSGPAAIHQHLGRYTSDDDLYDLTRSYAAAALRHRVSLHGGNMVPPPAEFGRSAVVDWSDYDRELRPLLDGTVFRRGEPLAGARLTTTDVVTVPGLSDEQTVLYWRAWVHHFRHRGWLDRLFLYLPDEPSPADYPEVLRLGSLARLADPELSTLLTEQLVPDLTEVIDVWTTLINCIDPNCGESPCEETVPRAAYAEVEERGADLWWYLSCASHGCGIVGAEATGVWPSYVIDAPPAAARIMPWLAWVHGVGGELYYNTVEAWGDGSDPWTDLHLHGGNGDGTLFYPGDPERIGGSTHVPVESLRLKLIREGLEDYEYLALLAAAGGGEDARARAGAVAGSVCGWERRPEAIYAAREAIARELARRAGGEAR